MSEKSILVVYNICGIKRDNISMWLNHLEDIINQNHPNFKIAISGCAISENSKQKLRELKDKYDNIVLNFIEDILPVNITFNHTVQICSEIFGLFDAYLYVASDVKFYNDKEVLSKLSYLHFNSDSVITNALVNHDHGLDGQYSECWDELNELLNTDHFYINVGKGINGHVILFDKSIYLSFNNKLVPDIFATHCTEMTYSYISAALGKKQSVHSKDIILGHIGFMDGHSAGFIEEIQYNDSISWGHLFKSKIPAKDRLLSQEAKESGFGYGEWLPIKLMPRDESMYDKDENHKNPQKLLDFLRKAIYLSENEFNYKDINFKFIE